MAGNEILPAIRRLRPGCPLLWTVDVIPGDGMIGVYEGMPCTLQTTGEYDATLGYAKFKANLGGEDTYIPFQQGKALSGHVGFHVNPGHIVCTYPMNGCALEVRERYETNEFYHDSDGKYMPQNAGMGNETKFRLTANDYNYDLFLRERVPRLDAEYSKARGLDTNFEYSIRQAHVTVLCIKFNPDWWIVYYTFNLRFRIMDALSASEVQLSSVGTKTPWDRPDVPLSKHTWLEAGVFPNQLFVPGEANIPPSIERYPVASIRFQNPRDISLTNAAKMKLRPNARYKILRSKHGGCTQAALSYVCQAARTNGWQTDIKISRSYFESGYGPELRLYSDVNHGPQRNF